MTTNQTRTVHVAVVDTLADWKIGYLTAYLSNGAYQRRPGAFRVATVGLTRDPVTTMGGITVQPDLALADLEPEASAMLVLPGAATWESGVLDDLVGLARRFLDAGTPVAAICGATYGLAAGGLLDARAHTGNDPGYLASSGYAGADRYVTDPVVTDGDLITASSVAPVHFAAAVFARLGSHDDAVLASWTKLFADRDPAGYLELEPA